MGQVTMVSSCSWPSPGPDPMVPTAQYLKHTAYGQLALRQRGPGVGILQGNRHQGPQGLLASLLALTALLQEARRAGRGQRLSRKKREAPGKTAGLVGGACRSWFLDTVTFTSVSVGSAPANSTPKPPWIPPLSSQLHSQSPVCSSACSPSLFTSFVYGDVNSLLKTCWCFISPGSDQIPSMGCQGPLCWLDAPLPPCFLYLNILPDAFPWTAASSRWDVSTEMTSGPERPLSLWWARHLMVHFASVTPVFSP